MLKVGIAGYGKMGQIRAHSIKKNSTLELKYIFDPLLSAETIDGVLYCESFDYLLESDCDLIFIAGYASSAANYTVKALAAGKHVFCEKPPAFNLQEIALIESVYKDSGKILKYGFNHRFHYSVIKAKQIIQSGAIGALHIMRGVYGKAGSIDFEDNWRNYKKFSGGGILMDQGIHMLDLFNYLSSKKLQTKSAIVKTLHWNIECEDNVMAILSSIDQQFICSLHSSATQWNHKFSLEIIGELGYLVLNGILTSTLSYAPETLIYGLRENPNLASSMGQPSENIYTFDTDNSWDLELEEFLAAINDQKEIVHGTLDQAREVIELVEQIYSFQNNAKN